MIGTPKGAGLHRARYAGVGGSGSVKTAVGSVLSPGEKPSGVAGAGAVATGAETVRGGRGGLLTAVASNAGRTIRPDRSRRFIAALDRGLSSPFAPWARGDQHRSAGAAFAPVAYPVSATTRDSDKRARPSPRVSLRAPPHSVRAQSHNGREEGRGLGRALSRTHPVRPGRRGLTGRYRCRRRR